jgi:hypothetical protein
MLLLMGAVRAGRSRATRTSAARESGSANLAAAAKEQVHAHGPHTLLAPFCVVGSARPQPWMVVAMSPHHTELVSAESLDRSVADDWPQWPTRPRLRDAEPELTTIDT